FFQAEDGIRDFHVTGVQTCALPIYAPDTCPPWMLRMTREAADELGVPVHVHCAQSVVEFDEMIRRYGRTPVEVLYDAGLVGPDEIGRASCRERVEVGVVGVAASRQP